MIEAVARETGILIERMTLAAGHSQNMDDGEIVLIQQGWLVMVMNVNRDSGNTGLHSRSLVCLVVPLGASSKAEPPFRTSHRTPKPKVNMYYWARNKCLQNVISTTQAGSGRLV